jgi:hypothetical protein
LKPKAYPGFVTIVHANGMLLVVSGKKAKTMMGEEGERQMKGISHYKLPE